MQFHPVGNSAGTNYNRPCTSISPPKKTYQNSHTIYPIEKAQQAITYSKLTIKTLEQGVKYVQS